MKVSAEYENGEWVFSRGGDILFHASGEMGRVEVGEIVSALNSHAALVSVAERLVKAREDFKTYDYALSSDNVIAIASDASVALSGCAVRCVERITVGPIDG